MWAVISAGSIWARRGATRPPRFDSQYAAIARSGALLGAAITRASRKLGRATVDPVVQNKERALLLPGRGLDARAGPESLATRPVGRPVPNPHISFRTC